ncbi:uncharacterized protein LOC129763321 [Toxorhynchites rutilus septentrionalis]|uniref:uncharacterized protein LOC129763321 n=1 Tax=Toxorhynchites rutilus septentrionalis TaxID=329112 RepID=UPI0024795B7E|nr:uncharacterized protein LOC129763321 [Toxorhynchites rutilus septentrionalis]
MSGQKFFHGLTDAMINRHRPADGPDRQKSSFFWPDEYMQDASETYRTSSGSHSSASSTPTKQCASPAGERETPEILMQRHRSNARSHITFDDGCDSSFSQLERERQREKLRIAQFLREQSDDVSEAAKQSRQTSLKSNFHFYDFVDTANEKSTPKAASPTTTTNGCFRAATPEQEELARYSPMSNGTAYRKQHSSPAASEYHYSARYTGSYDDFEDDRSFKSNDFNYNGFSPPGTPLGGEIPEHKRMSQRHLRSSINFSNGVLIAEDSSAPRKPASVRESATDRVGVGLPNL